MRSDDEPRLLDEADDEQTTRIALPRDSARFALPASALEPLPPPPPPTTRSLATGVSDPTAAAPPLLVRAPVPPPLPCAPKPTVAQPVSTILNVLQWWRGRYPTVGTALFAAGVLVGVVGTVTVLRNGAPAVVEAAPSSATFGTAAVGGSVLERPKAALAAPPPVVAPKPVAEPAAPVEPGPKKNLEMPAEPTKDPTLPPVSQSMAPSCQKLLGKSLKERSDPKRANYQTTLANRELVRGNVTEAHRAYCLAWAWDRKNIDRHVNLARLYLIRRDWEKAAELGQSALALDPTNRAALGVIGDAWAALHKTEAARAAWLAAQNKPNPSAHELRVIVRRDLALGNRMERLRDFSLAERYYRRALLMDPTSTRAMLGIANCLLRGGDPRTANAWSRKAKGRS